MIFSLGNGKISHEESSGEGAPENLAANPRPARGRGVRPRGIGPKIPTSQERIRPFYILTNSRSGLTLHHSLINGPILKGLMQSFAAFLEIVKESSDFSAYHFHPQHWGPLHVTWPSGL